MSIAYNNNDPSRVGMIVGCGRNRIWIQMTTRASIDVNTSTIHGIEGIYGYSHDMITSMIQLQQIKVIKRLPRIYLSQSMNLSRD